MRIFALGLILAMLVFPTAVLADPANDSQAKIKVGIYVLNIGKFDTSSGSYTVDFYLNLKCADNSTECMSDFEFMNGRAISKELTIDTPHEKVYRIQADLADNVDLMDYPFDSHRLSINLEDTQRQTDELVYIADPGNSGIDPKVTLVGWELEGGDSNISEHHYETFNETYSFYSYGINIKRISLASILKIFVPVFFIVFIASLALLIKPENINNRLGMSTASLISAVMFHLSATSSIPPVGYITFADKFMLGTYAILLANLAWTVLLMRYTEKGQEKEAEKGYNAALITVPALTLLIYALIFLRIV